MSKSKGCRASWARDKPRQTPAHRPFLSRATRRNCQALASAPPETLLQGRVIHLHLVRQKAEQAHGKCRTIPALLRSKPAAATQAEQAWADAASFTQVRLQAAQARTVATATPAVALLPPVSDYRLGQLTRSSPSPYRHRWADGNEGGPATSPVSTGLTGSGPSGARTATAGSTHTSCVYPFCPSCSAATRLQSGG